MKRLLLSILGICVIAAAAWSVSTILHDSAGGPPVPGRGSPQVVIANAPAATPEQTPATRPAEKSINVPLAQQASYLSIRYLPDSADDAEQAADNQLGTTYQFPPARVRVSGKADEAGNVLLFSDDPKEAINKDWVGDRYYFAMESQMPLDVFDWSCSNSPGQKEETGNGVFLHGDQYHLEPLRLRVQFGRENGELKVIIAGEFLQYDTTNPNAPPKHCQVTGILSPRVDGK